MTADATDMSTPVTGGELRAELQQFEERLEQRFASLMTRVDLEFWGGVLLARIESGEQRMIQRMDSLEQRLLIELGRHTRAIQESLSAQIAVVDEKYADLPPRVTRLEGAVFPPK
jgi:hypothetical protein